MYLLDKSGKVAFKSGRGPYLFKPAELEQSLVLLLQAEGAAKPSNEHADARALSTGLKVPAQSRRLVGEQAVKRDRRP
jgi:hypothetical protein